MNQKNQPLFGWLKSKICQKNSEPKITGKEYPQLLTNAREVELQNVHDKNIFDLPLNKYASTYSTGMQKKLALTAILLQQNEVFILDETFNGVDIQSNLVITEIIKKLKALKKTFLTWPQNWKNSPSAIGLKN